MTSHAHARLIEIRFWSNAVKLVATGLIGLQVKIANGLDVREDGF